ncbi:uncharacterized protein LOC110973892 [Acanthaster planci]|uniref:Uncharacterized protein LOC110973892 n=1 Tax=Acanthaster planci TaxID=133434 RepID=A0A8B7XKW0_ACAPL|nr:uncharacterized protein LOC110973892 [Acanthaster planci]
MATIVTSGLSETFFGLLSVMSLLCATSVKSSPVSTVVISTFDPTTSVEASTFQVPCEPTGTSTYTSTSNVQTTYDILSIYTSCLVRKSSSVFKRYEEERFGEPLYPLMEVSLPDITTLSTPGLCGADRLATHYFILDGFKKAMVGVMKDEEQHNGSRNFGGEFKNMNRLLGKVLQGTRELICSNGLQGESQIEEVQGVFFEPVNREILRSVRDYTVLHRINEYVKQLNFDILGNIGSADGSAMESDCVKPTV